MLNFKKQSLEKYLNQLASKEPAPGGGSAAALCGALGASLISMVAHYSIGRKKDRNIEGKIKKNLIKSEKIRKRLLELVDLDAKAYLAVVKARKQGNAAKKKAALKRASQVPLEVCGLCQDATQLLPFLVEHGNPYLLSDVKVSGEMLLAAFNSALVNVKVNQ